MPSDVSSENSRFGDSKYVLGCVKRITLPWREYESTVALNVQRSGRGNRKRQSESECGSGTPTHARSIPVTGKSKYTLRTPGGQNFILALVTTLARARQASPKSSLPYNIAARCCRLRRRGGGPAVTATGRNA
ncbi:hypothetical protein EVAR_66865_1 [Eumeta japonica]|uniref:Uncharacterized protein n=1 Tax=Eumeta variegata TaxID=151549 RepID=A0A4C1ZRK1_EUMVA|nr:hypothetical protein EVAR_66865_1 [Eumeta japonica]